MAWPSLAILYKSQSWVSNNLLEASSFPYYSVFSWNERFIYINCTIRVAKMFIPILILLLLQQALISCSLIGHNDENKESNVHLFKDGTIYFSFTSVTGTPTTASMYFENAISHKSGFETKDEFISSVTTSSLLYGKKTDPKNNGHAYVTTVDPFQGFKYTATKHDVTITTSAARQTTVSYLSSWQPNSCCKSCCHDYHTCYHQLIHN